jgi:hypothetical protein
MDPSSFDLWSRIPTKSIIAVDPVLGLATCVTRTSVMSA